MGLSFNTFFSQPYILSKKEIFSDVLNKNFHQNQNAFQKFAVKLVSVPGSLCKIMERRYHLIFTKRCNLLPFYCLTKSAQAITLLSLKILK
jgi:hypothetical protein